ncbi:acyl-CoA dehydrogenase family protein [Streptomyces thinghirensis]|nr:acyl-CoA dehydrogenase family protein [Streptomyces thinghirensis]
MTQGAGNCATSHDGPAPEKRPKELRDHPHRIRRAQVPPQSGIHLRQEPPPLLGTDNKHFWQEAAKLGYIGVNLPEAYGGGGGGITELSLVLEEMGAAGNPC